MTDREKLIALIASGVACPDDRDPFGEYCDSCRYEKSADCSNERLADHLIAHGVTVQGWIPVKDRLPFAECGESDDVLAITELGVMRTLHFDGGNWCFQNGECCPHKVTHWMPLPEPPKGE